MGSEDVKTSSFWLTTRDGAEMHYFEVKPRQENIENRFPTVIIHGWGASSLAFLELARELAKESFLTLALDMRGHGLSKEIISTGKEKKSSLRAMLEDLDEFISKKGIDRVNLIGFSMGGAIAQLYALKRPEKVVKLVLLSSSCRFKLPLYMKAVLYLPEWFVGAIMRQMPRYFPILLKNKIRKNSVEYLADGFYHVNLKLFRRSLRELQVFNIKGYLYGLLSPVLLIAGTDDPIISKTDLKNYKNHVLYPGLTHLAFFEEWQTSTDILKAFLKANAE